MLILGIDENGLGPKLGPLVATACGIEFGSYNVEKWHHRATALGVDDSKKTSAFGKMALAESICLALIEKVSGDVPRSVRNLFDVIGLDSISEYQRLCPDDVHQKQCWGSDKMLPLFGGDVEHGRDTLTSLEDHGCQFRYLKSHLSCPKKINYSLTKGMNKFQLDLKMFEQLFLDCQKQNQKTIHALCGMVGGIRKYENYFSVLQFEWVSKLKEAEGGFSYRVNVPGGSISELSFQTDADANHFPVALASMVGKYVREAWMLNMADFYREQDVIDARVSGYHDSKTKRMIQNSHSVRKRLGIVEECFIRQK